VSSPKLVTKSTKDGHLDTPKTNSKRKRTPGKEKVLDYGENLVGSKIKVWWPDDNAFYKGVIDSLVAKQKHKVLYDDGDEEILNLKKEKWEFIGDDSGSDGEQETDHHSPEASTEMYVLVSLMLTFQSRNCCFTLLSLRLSKFNSSVSSILAIKFSESKTN
jgi:hypothetical protein